MNLHGVDPDVLNQQKNYKMYEIGLGMSTSAPNSYRSFCWDNLTVCCLAADDKSQCYWLGRLHSIDGATK